MLAVQGLHEDTDSDDEWTDDEMEASALDSVDPYINFAEALTTVQVCPACILAMSTCMLTAFNCVHYTLLSKALHHALKDLNSG